METDRDARAVLAEAERAATLPYTEYPAMPAWYPPAVGAWAAGMVLALAGAQDRPVVFFPVIAVLLGTEGAFFAWYRRRSGVMPSLRDAPAEFAGAMRWYFAGVVVVVAAVAASWWLVGPWLAATLAFALVAAGLWWYERAYAAAARATRRRVS